MNKTIEYMSQIATTIEQSERLMKAGLYKGSADMTWNFVPYEDEYWLGVAREDSQHYADYPAWSLSRLWDILVGGHTRVAPDGDSSVIIEKLVSRIILGIENGLIDKKHLK